MSDGPGPDYEGELLNLEREVLQLRTNLAASKHRRHRIDLEIRQIAENDAATEQAIADAEQRIEELRTLVKEQTDG